jgi:hypothetical protein
MFHDKRIWCVQHGASAEELTRYLTEFTMCCCCGFELDGYLFLNDSTSADGGQEYAVLRKPNTPDTPYVQIESITFGWCDFTKGLQYVRDILAGRYDSSEFTQPVRPHLQTSHEHGSCHFCA